MLDKVTVNGNVNHQNNQGHFGYNIFMHGTHDKLWAYSNGRTVFFGFYWVYSVPRIGVADCRLATSIRLWEPNTNAKN